MSDNPYNFCSPVTRIQHQNILLNFTRSHIQWQSVNLPRFNMLNAIFYALLLLLFSLLFIGGADDNSGRLIKTLWDTGHLFLFAGLALALLNRPWLKNRRGVFQWGLITLLTLSFGLGIEIVQLQVGRYFEYMDVLFDLLGAYLGLLVFYILRSQNKALSSLKTLPLILLILLIVFWPVFMAYQDKQQMQLDFPVLADFESRNELSRWEENNVRILLQTKYVRHGHSALAIEFQPAQYPGFAMHEFIGNWQGYQYLAFSFYNPTKENRQIELKVYDRQHKANGQQYADRFNRVMTLQPGWNDIKIRLADIRRAPEKRSMEMSDIIDVSLFLNNPKYPLLLYFDYLRLSSE